MEKKNLFQDFDPVLTKDWVQKIEQELKGKPVEELTWAISEEIQLAPFYREAQTKTIAPAVGNNWKIMERLDVEEIPLANKQLLEGLMGGVNAPKIILTHPFSPEELSVLFSGVDFGYISTHLKAPNGFILLQQFYNIITTKGLNSNLIEGSIEGIAEQELSKALWFAVERMSNFKVITIDAEELYEGKENVPDELAAILKKGELLFNQLTEEGLEADLINQHLQINLAVGTSYFVAIAKLRAIKTLWANLSAAYDGEPTLLPTFSVATAVQDYSEDQHMNMLRATTQAMSAVIGGADFITVTPSNANLGQPDAFSRRIARNVLHLLEQESYLNKVADPSSGSFYIEKLTDILVEKAWEKFVNM